jgi:diacylglycerol kinase (ATP)
MNQYFRFFSPTLLFAALRNSMSGIVFALKSERAVQQEVLLFLVGTIAAFLLGDTGVERAILIGSLALILIVEMLNSAIEAAVDRIGHELHPLSKQAKDLGSAAVFISLLTAIGIWILVLT